MCARACLGACEGQHLAQQLRRKPDELSLLDHQLRHRLLTAESADELLQLRHGQLMQLQRLRLGRRPALALLLPVAVAGQPLVALAEELARHAVKHVVELVVQLRLCPRRIAAVAALVVPRLGALN